MVALRGKKANAPAKPKAVEKVEKMKGGKAAAKDEAKVRAQQQQPARTKDEEFLACLRFLVQATLGTSKPQSRHDVGAFLTAALTALCGTGKDRHLSPSQILAKLTRAARKRVCGAVFTADEIAYSCRNCQLDATCVTCKDCFMHSDHAGHDVYFQRTTAGSSCDCGDPHAWKQSGFCSKHQGADTSETGSRKSRLPKPIGHAAPVVIDAVVDHVYQVLLGVHYGFELAEAFELFTRNISPEFLPIHTQSEQAAEDDEAARRSAAADLAANDARFYRAINGSLNTASPSQPSDRSDDFEIQGDGPVPFSIRLHNDDCHSMHEVINHLCVAMEFSKRSAQTITDQTDRYGDSVLSKRALVKCPLVVGNLVRRTLNVSVIPTWMENQIQGLADIFEWLQTVSASSDGLGELVSEALSKQRGFSFHGFASYSSNAVEHMTLSQFAKDCGIRLHPKAATVLNELIGEDTPIRSWIDSAEETKARYFKLWSSESNQPDTISLSPSVALAHSNGELGCKNVFIEEFVKSVSLSGAYTRHASVREGFNSVVSKYFVSTSASTSSRSTELTEPLSALTLLVQYDCTLRKATADKVHSLIREHLLEIDFRTHLLQSYMQCYKRITDMFLRGLGNSSESIFDFAVQFLTVPHLVQGYSRAEARKHPERRQIIGELLAGLKMVFQSAIDHKTGTLSPDHPSLSSQKYKHCIENMEYVFNVGSFSGELMCDPDNMKLWLACLAIIQGGDPQIRRGVHQSHVEYESDSWLPMFNLGIRVHSIFSVSWSGFKADQLAATEMSLADVFKPILEATIASSALMNEKVATKKLAPVKALFDLSSHGRGPERNIVSYRFNVAADPTSLHIPLHRYLSAAIRQLTIFHPEFQSTIESDGLLRAFGFDKLQAEDKYELIEMPLRCLVMASQIHSGLWRRNGDENMLAQLYNYSALPYCVHYRDADVFMLQLGVLMTGADQVIARMMDHYQLGSYFALRSALDGFGYSKLEEGIDDQQRLQMLEEFLRLIIVMGTALPAATGVTYENEFLLEEMLQQLCSKSQSFSKLFELAILPTGQDDIPVARLESALVRVAEFVPPSGLEPGRYELKKGLLERYNPYFLHLNRESHELARDRWTSFRNLQRRKAEHDTSNGKQPHEPLRPAARPLPFLQPVQAMLTCESTLLIVHVILWNVLSAENLSSSSVVSDAVISTSLHLLVHGVHTAVRTENADAFWERVCKREPLLGDNSILHLLSKLLERAKTLLDGEQTGTLEWLVWKIDQSSAKCASVFKQLNDSKQSAKLLSAAANQSSGNGGDAAGGAAAPLTLEQRKAEARARALAAMAQKQAAFQAMMANFEDENDEHSDMDEDKDDNEVGASSRRKRRGSDESEKDELATKKRQKVGSAVEEDSAMGPKCILCHDSHEAGQMGMAAYLHQSTVLATGFRPEPQEALNTSGKRVRTLVKDVIAKMELCSGSTSTSSSDAMSPILRAFSAPPLPEWYISTGQDDDGAARDGAGAGRASPRMARVLVLEGGDAPTQGPPRRRHERIRFGGGNLPMIQGELLQADEDMDVLEGVLDMEDDQRLFGLDARGRPVNPRAQRPMLARRGGRVGRTARRFDPRQNMRVIFDDSDEEDDEDSAFEHTFGAALSPHSRRHHGHNPPGFDNSIHDSSQLYLTPCGLHIRTCQHAVHIDCLERYITSLHDKAIRGEDFDGVQAIDPDSAMTQFLCPLCKTLSNFLMPISMPVGKKVPKVNDPDMEAESAPEYEEKRSVSSVLVSASSSWIDSIQQQLKVPGWCRTVLGRDDTAVAELGNMDEHNMWREYFEETLWEPHGSLEKGAPFLWSACGFTLASFLLVVEDEHRNLSGGSAPLFDPLVDRCPPSLEKEMESLVAVTKFCRWSFLMLEHSTDAKVIWETSKRCCPINCETKREYRKFTNVLGSVDPCLRGTILGLLVADSFTAFIVSTVVAEDPATIWSIIPVFSAADLIQRFYVEFFKPRKADKSSLFQDKYTAERDAAKAAATPSSASGKRGAAPHAPAEVASSQDEDPEVRRTRSGRVIGQTTTVTSPAMSRTRSRRSSKSNSSDSPVTIISDMMESLANQDSNEYVALGVLKRMVEASVADKNPLILEAVSLETLSSRLANVLRENATFVRRMKLFWRCLSRDESFEHSFSAESLVIPTLSDIAESPDAVFDQVWRWCDDRMTSKSYLGVARSSGANGDHGDRCEHTEGCSEAYVASMFILREVPRKPQLIDLPIQYDELYSALSGRTCDRCGKTPSDPGICLVCGEFLCCGDSCCTRAFIAQGPPVGECTRHAAECGGGIGIVLLLDQCRVAIIGGSMAAHFPSPYVDAHGEEDVGLQRGRPLRLDMARYRHLEGLWLQHRLFSEVSRQRNQRDPQYTINLSYL